MMAMASSQFSLFLPLPPSVYSYTEPKDTVKTKVTSSLSSAQYPLMAFHHPENET
jgi:hypothetical protein